MVDRLVGCFVGACVLLAPALASAQSQDSVIARERRAAARAEIHARRPARLLISNLAALGASSIAIALPAIGALPNASSMPGASGAAFISLATVGAAAAATLTYWASAQAMGGGSFFVTTLGFGLGALLGSLTVLFVDPWRPTTLVVPVVSMTVMGLIGQSLANELSIPDEPDVSRLRARRWTVLPRLTATSTSVSLSIGGAL